MLSYFVLTTSLFIGCGAKQQRISLKNLLPTQINSVPIGIKYEEFSQRFSKKEFEQINIGPSIFYLKENIESSDLRFIQYQFQNNVLSEVLIGYKASFAAQDIATELYGAPNENGAWLAQYDNQNIVIQIVDNTLIYR